MMTKTRTRETTRWQVMGLIVVHEMVVLGVVLGVEYWLIGGRACKIIELI